MNGSNKPPNLASFAATSVMEKELTSNASGITVTPTTTTQIRAPTPPLTPKDPRRSTTLNYNQMYQIGVHRANSSPAAVGGNIPRSDITSMPPEGHLHGGVGISGRVGYSQSVHYPSSNHFRYRGRGSGSQEVEEDEEGEDVWEECESDPGREAARKAAAAVVHTQGYGNGVLVGGGV